MDQSSRQGFPASKHFVAGRFSGNQSNRQGFCRFRVPSPSLRNGTTITTIAFSQRLNSKHGASVWYLHNITPTPLDPHPQSKRCTADILSFLTFVFGHVLQARQLIYGHPLLLVRPKTIHSTPHDLHVSALDTRIAARSTLPSF